MRRVRSHHGGPSTMFPGTKQHARHARPAERARETDFRLENARLTTSPSPAALLLKTYSTATADMTFPLDLAAKATS